MIQITLAGEKRQIAAHTTVEDLLKLENAEMPDYVSVSVNEQFVQRATFGTAVLHEGDTVEFLYYMGGGQ